MKVAFVKGRKMKIEEDRRKPLAHPIETLRSGKKHYKLEEWMDHIPCGTN